MLDVIWYIYLGMTVVTCVFRLKYLKQEREENEGLYNLWPTLRNKGIVFRAIDGTFKNIWKDIFWPIYWYKRLRSEDVK